MNTQLTPPPITPGKWEVWGANMGPIPLMWKDGEAFDYLPGFTLWAVESISKWPENTQKQIYANYQLLAAAPQMAEALENCRQYLASLPQSMHTESAPVYLAALAALLQAGYTSPTADL